MARHRSIITRLVFSTLACVLISAVSISELPEHLTLTNDTSNDYTVQSPTLQKTIRSLRSARQDSELLVASVLPDPSSQFSAVVFEDSTPMGQGLFILHSVLRR